jgi:hypothetical protein
MNIQKLQKKSTESYENIFENNDIYHMLKYYMYILIAPSTTFEDWSSHINFQRQSTVFPQKTFQEFIDKSINIKTIGTDEYQRFIVSMQNTEFKNNMIEKYNKYELESVIKNNLIYLVELYNKKGNKQKYYSTEEQEELDYLDMVPFYEYMSKVINDTNKENSTTSILDIVYLQNLETTVMEFILHT